MNEETSWKVIITAVGGIISAKLQLLAPILVVLAVIMLLDLAMGVAAATIEKDRYPEVNVVVSSTTLAKGAIRKFAAILIIIATFMIDVIIAHYMEVFEIDFGFKPIFVILISVYFLAREFMSLCENYVRMGNTLPNWMGALGKAIEATANSKGERYVKIIEDMKKENDKNE